MNLNTPSGRAELRTRRTLLLSDQPTRTSDEAYAQMERMQAFDQRVRDEDVRALALEHQEREAVRAEADILPRS